MYINFKYAKNKGLSEVDILTLQIIKQLRTEPQVEENLVNVLTDDFLLKAEENGYITQIKGKKGDSELGRLRLTKKGAKLLDDIETSEVEEEDIILFEWLEGFYKSEGKMIGNKKRTKTGIAQFRKHTGIEKNALAFLLKEFISDEENMKFNNKLEAIFFSSKNLYSRKFNIEECRLYTYYDLRRKYFDNKFRTF